MNTRMFRRHGLALLLMLMAAPSLWAANVQDPASPTILLTGSNRGVGLALAQEYAARGWNVIATCRTPSKAKDLQALAASNPKVLVETLDVTDVRQISKLAEKYRDEGKRYFLQIEECSLMTSEVRTVCEALKQKIARGNIAA